ncbi:MAG: type II toxin-antitoxin system RelE/ParE family toxin [Planctomycetes bacterium]|nr:type II toxin-antitoxin system RelE/ParE family toxin [Planctomycetota bacterium]
MKLIWSPEAVAQFEAILDFIGARSPANAEKWGREFLSAIKKVAPFPESGRAIPEHGDEILREWLIGKYRGAYIVSDSGVKIVAVWHGAKRSPGRGVRGEIDDE